LYPTLIRRKQLDANSVKQLLSFGGWMTVSNLVGPLLLYLGRFLIAVLVSAEAVAYFSTPYEVVAAMLIVPSAFVSALFPTFARLFPCNHRDVEGLYWRAMLGMSLVMLPITALAFVFAKPGLSWWINKEFSDNGYLVAQLLAIGVFVNSFGHLSQALVQAYGRPDLTAKLHVAELIAYVPYLLWLTETHGITGAAIAWLLRVTLSTAALVFLAIRCMNGSLSTRYQKAVE
jgi:O-antigen/teichoic acid export membrane protein